MSKILVVEPYKMLQHAIGLSFFPDHEVKFADSVPEFDADEISGYDALVLDAAALREKNSFSPQIARAVENWNIPTIWLDTPEGSLPPTRDKRVVLQKPVAKEALLAALAECLGIKSRAKLDGASRALQLPEGVSPASPEVANTPAGRDDSGIIELVDVVEGKVKA